MSNEKDRLKKTANDIRNYLDAKSDEELVSIIVEEYADQGLTHEELMEAGHDGIAKAHEKYEEKNGFSFNAYAVWWVRQRIIQALNEKE